MSAPRLGTCFSSHPATGESCRSFFLSFMGAPFTGFWLRDFEYPATAGTHPFSSLCHGASVRIAAAGRHLLLTIVKI